MKTKAHGLTIALLMVTNYVWAQGEAPYVQVQQTRQHENIVAGLVALPAEGRWQVRPAEFGATLVDIYMTTDGKAVEPVRGERFAKLEKKRILQRHRRAFGSLFRQINRFSREHNGRSPKQSDPIPDRLAQMNTQQWWPEQTGPGPYYFILPDVPVLKRDEQNQERWNRVRHEEAQPLALELQPYLDDGQHWVLMSDGQVQRQKIDLALIKKYDLKIVPALAPESVDPVSQVRTRTYKILARRAGLGPGTTTVVLDDQLTEASLECRWTLTESDPVDEQVGLDWATVRAAPWLHLASRTDAPVLRTWLGLVQNRKGQSGFGNQNQDRRGRARRGRTTNMFNVLGGRAAVRQTLQLQALEAAGGDQAERSIRVADIQGVEVESHPFEQMLADLPEQDKNGRLALADSVPADRFFVYVAKPAQMLEKLDKGGAVLSKLGGTALGNRLDYDLVDRYLKRLGPTENFARLIVNSGLVQEMGIVCPDLFFIDGTDLTVVARLPQIKLALPLLAKLGIEGLSQQEPVVIKTMAQTQAWWMLRGDLLVLSTNLKELKGVIALIDSHGQGSLGQSAEFGYMLSKLPLNKSTLAYAYLSDPFIRRLVGPAVKIGQLRRLQARAAMETLAGAALLYQVQGHGDQPTPLDLAKVGYSPTVASDHGFELEGGRFPVSPVWGRPAAMKTLLQNPVQKVAPKEAKAYQNYLDNYNRFWRQFFDPIAVRLDLKGNQTADLTTFILPLLDSQIYNGLRQLLGENEIKDNGFLAPKLEPGPVLMFSLNVSSEGWLEMLEDFSRGLSNYSQVDPVIFDHLGPALHLAVMDASPIVNLGSGDLLGAFGGNIAGGWFGNEMVAIPLALSVLTRPCRLLIELDDPEAVRNILRVAAMTSARRTRGFLSTNVQFSKITGRDAWLYTLSIEGLIKLRFGVQVQDRYLVISNLPWSKRVVVQSNVTQPLNGAALQVWPGTVQEELAALFQSAQEGRRSAALEGIGYLTPFMLAGAGSPQEAADQHAALFGFKPVHPAGGAWRFQEGQIVSTLFGGLGRAEFPEHQPGDRAFGLFGGVDHLSVNMQLEDTGLRTHVHWTWGKGSKDQDH